MRRARELLEGLSDQVCLDAIEGQGSSFCGSPCRQGSPPARDCSHNFAPVPAASVWMSIYEGTQRATVPTPSEGVEQANARIDSSGR